MVIAHKNSYKNVKMHEDLAALYIYVCVLITPLEKKAVFDYMTIL